jgi:NAD(P)H-dependent flavin oxidoreductase YrpB (nitropropane dioxygenase family)
MLSRAVADLLERLKLDAPVLQAGMGGGLAGHELAAAVSDAGGLGTIGMLDAGRLREELRRARVLTGRSLAVNLLLPFAHPAHWDVAGAADAVVTFWGKPERRTAGLWIHQCGSVAEGLAAVAAGADGVIAQGVEAGGHVRGELPGLVLLEQLRSALPAGYPVLLAGGIATAADTHEALSAGAAAVVAGTRFLMSDESAAHPGYKQRLAQADSTLLTELFGVGWPGRHRVIPNAATDRWQRGSPSPPAALKAVHRATVPLADRLPLGLVDRVTAAVQRPWLPLFGPFAPLRHSPERLLDAAPLYAGETVCRIQDVRPARELVVELTAG